MICNIFYTVHIRDDMDCWGEEEGAQKCPKHETQMQKKLKAKQSNVTHNVVGQWKSANRKLLFNLKLSKTLQTKNLKVLLFILFSHLFFLNPHFQTFNLLQWTPQFWVFLCLESVRIWDNRSPKLCRCRCFFYYQYKNTNLWETKHTHRRSLETTRKSGTNKSVLQFANFCKCVSQNCERLQFENQLKIINRKKEFVGDRKGGVIDCRNLGNGRLEWSESGDQLLSCIFMAGVGWNEEEEEEKVGVKTKQKKESYSHRKKGDGSLGPFSKSSSTQSSSKAKWKTIECSGIIFFGG